MFQIEAELFANNAHSSINQKRKYTNDPYICHPRNVAYLVKIVGGTDEMIAAAFLHDVLEDVAPKNPLFSEEEIIKRFGGTVASYVIWLTDISRLEDGNREIRRTIDRKHTAKSPKEVKTIKLADLIDNSLTITEFDPGFSKIYLREKRLLMPFLEQGNSELWNIANKILLKHGY